MSDARQAIKAAAEQGAEEREPERYRRARTLLDEAETHLDHGRFVSARETAEAARYEARTMMRVGNGMEVSGSQ